MIKNRTSAVPIERTVARIEAALVRGGAYGIRKDYEGGQLHSVTFVVKMPATPQHPERHITVRLPANISGVYDALRTQVRKPRRGTLDKLRDQAARTAWKLTQDWVELQMTRIALHQSDFLQAFLAEVWDGKRTYYTALKEDNYRALLGPVNAKDQTYGGEN